ncbi:MAG TPA: type II toxin-antitoxin system RelE/ParE family toxin [Gemmatimonadaceae bacterium]|nr:type II toxin-antitoxin system RelE/ParE family toxin [Gemmatimonadaceae bacterium]
MSPKPIFWVGGALDDLRSFPDEVRRMAGHELHLVQLGLLPSDWKPMPTVTAGVREIRIHSGAEHRVFYVANFPEGIYVLHAFEKRSRRTRRADMALAKQRLRDVLRHRRDHSSRQQG